VIELLPKKPLQACKKTGCTNLTSESFCADHAKQEKKRHDATRKNSYQRGYDKQWQKVRKAKTNNDPLCEECLKHGKIIPVEVVHHVIPISERPDLRLAIWNLMSLCTMHHEEIHKEDRWKGGFAQKEI